MLKRIPNWSNLALALVLAGGMAACEDDGGVTTPTLPATPTGVTAVRQGTGVQVSWNAVSGAQSYIVEKQTGGSGAYAQIASSVSGTSYTDAGTAPGLYAYRVLAVNGTQRSAPSDAAILTIAEPGRAEAFLRGAIASGQTRTLSADTLYVMQGTVVVDSGAVLRIPAGTRVVGDAEVRPTALLVRVGGQIFAEGTAERPIVFTSSKPVGQRARGDWGGIIIAGRSNCSFPAPCQAEGISTRYGGDRADDNSGILRYVRIEFAGFEVSPGNELNGLTLAGVGSGTQIDHVQVHYGSDDGIEWFGGTVNVKYAIATGNDDDSFDYSTGWAGKGQFWIAQQAENAGDKGFEVDGNESNFAATPVTDPQIFNVTLVGRGTGASSGNDAIQLRRGVRGSIRNAIVLGWGGAALDVDDQATADHCAGATRLVDNVIWFQASAAADDDSDAFEAACSGSDWRNVDPQLGAATNRAAPNFVPAAGSPALTGAATVPNDGFFTAASFLGAVAPTGTPWYQGWTTFATN